jgi:hypothetical protein
MFKRTIKMTEVPHITLTECLGDLVVRGTAIDQIEVQLQGTADDATVEQDDGDVTLACRAGCILICPQESTLAIHTLRGDLKVRGVVGSIRAGTVNGDVVLRDVGPVVLESVYGDLIAREVEGDLTLEMLQGDGRVREVAGLVTIEQVGGDLRAKGLHAGLEAGQVGADVRLGPPFSPGATYQVQAGSDLRVDVPAGASLRLVLQAGGHVRSHVAELALDEAGDTTEGILGDGEALLEARVGGHVYLRPDDGGSVSSEDLEFDLAADLEGLGSLIELRISEAMADMQARLEESLGQVGSEAFRRRIEQAAEKARWKTQRAADQMRLQMEREAERARLQAERAERRWRRVSGRQAPTREPAVSDEERMRVLRLVERGKITPEEAADLLAALEGR